MMRSVRPILLTKKPGFTGMHLFHGRRAVIETSASNRARRPWRPLVIALLDGIRLLLLVGVLTTLFSPAFAGSITPPRYRITDLGHIEGGFASYAKGINSSGQIVGSDSRIYQSGTISAPRAFLYDGIMHDLGTLGGDVSDASGINEAGQVVGAATHLPLPDNTRHAFLYDGTMHDLGTLGGPSSVGLGLNNRGDVVGSADLASADVVFHAFLYDGVMHDLGVLEGMLSSQANGINDSGQIVGVSWNPNTTPRTFRPFLYDGTMHDLGTLGGDFFNTATAINQKGVVVGHSTLATGATHAFLYDGAMHDLGALFVDRETFALAINGVNQVVGQWVGSPTGTGAFLYQNASLYDLKGLLDATGDEWEYLIEAAGINDAGQIVGAGVNRESGEVRAFRLDQIRIITVDIEIKPGTPPPVLVNPKAHGKIPVAILSSATFNARSVDPSTVTLAGAPVDQKPDGTRRVFFRDVNGDGLIDMVVRVKASRLQLVPTDTEAELDGQTVDGSIIRGTEAIQVVLDPPE